MRLPDSSPATYAFDTFSPLSPSAALPLLIFYASPTSGPSFIPLFSTLYSLSTSSPPRAAFTIRWKPSAKDLATPLVLSAFGAGLDIKKSDYLVVDDRLSSGANRIASSSESRAKILPIPKDSLPGPFLAIRPPHTLMPLRRPRPPRRLLDPLLPRPLHRLHAPDLLLPSPLPLSPSSLSLSRPRDPRQPNVFPRLLCTLLHAQRPRSPPLFRSVRPAEDDEEGTEGGAGFAAVG